MSNMVKSGTPGDHNLVNIQFCVDIDVIALHRVRKLLPWNELVRWQKSINI